jgi:hypothetical protein
MAVWVEVDTYVLKELVLEEGWGEWGRGVRHGGSRVLSPWCVKV